MVGVEDKIKMEEVDSDNGVPIIFIFRPEKESSLGKNPSRFRQAQASLDPPSRTLLNNDTDHILLLVEEDAQVKIYNILKAKRFPFPAWLGFL